MLDKIWFSNLNLSYELKRALLRFIDIDNLFEIYWRKNRYLLKSKEKDIKDILKYKEKELKRFDIFEKSKKDFEYMKDNGIDIMIFSDKIYPKQLLDLQEFPLYLYYIGDTSILNSKKLISIIGSRNFTNYGRKVCYDFSEKLAKSGFVIVSGLAIGIDSIAQSTCIENGGKTIGIIGSGLDNFYPKQNLCLFNDICNNYGLVISEFPLGTAPLKQNFPWRNRIIAALGASLLVIESKEKSGTFITTNYALDLGKEIFCIPCDIYSKNTRTNFLISQGAKIVTCIEDILDEY